MTSLLKIIMHRAKPSDMGGIYQIEKSCFNQPFSQNYLKRMIEDKRYVVFVARREHHLGSIVGYVSLLKALDEAQIMTIAIEGRHRGIGVGRALMSHMINYFQKKDFRSIFLEVRPSNSAARNLYDSLGFVKIGIRAKYYQDTQEDAIVMRLDLAENVKPACSERLDGRNAS